MASLYIHYDLEKKQFIGASSAGKIFTGLSSVVLRNGSVSLIDIHGQDLLGGAASSPEEEHTKAQADIASAFGYGAQS